MILTQRLMLRPWWDDDFNRAAGLLADPELFSPPYDRAGSDAFIARAIVHFGRHGFGLWAVEAPGVSPLIGITGLQTVPDKSPLAPAVEIRWWLARKHWGHGYATEAARTTIADGFSRCGLRMIIARASPGDLRSRAIMERLGMTPDGAMSSDILYRLHAPAGGSA